MTGKWQKEIPSKAGKYWTATRDGLLNQPLVVAYDKDGKLYYAGGYIQDTLQSYWCGWWWSEPIDEPIPPSKDAWTNDNKG